MAEKIRVGVIGSGSRGIRSFGRLFNERDDCEVVALADPNEERMAAAETLLGGAPLNKYTDLAEMVQQKDLDVAVVTTPDCYHKDAIVAALEAGKNVLTDKPMATNTADCMEICRVAKRTGGTVDMGFNLRHEIVCKKTKEIVDSGILGNLVMISNTDYYAGGKTYMGRWNRFYEMSGGLFCHKGAHDLDIINWLNAGALPVKVAAFAGVNVLKPEGIPFELKEGEKAGPYCEVCRVAEKCPDWMGTFSKEMFTGAPREADGYNQDTCIYMSEKDTHDNGVVIIEYDNGVRASHWECFVSAFSTRRFSIVGDRGQLDADLKENAVTVYPKWTNDRIEHKLGRPTGGHGGADPTMVAKFVENLKSGSKPVASVKDGTLSVVIAEAAEKSRREGRIVMIEELLSKKDIADLG